MRIPKPKAQLLALGLLLVFIGCHPGDQKAPGSETVHLVFKHGKIAGDPAIFRDLLNRFEKLHPGIKVKDETLPASTDEQHQFYVINLEGGSSDFDVLSLDVIWVPEFARAGWLRDLSRLFSEGQRKDFFSGPMEAVTFNGSAYACPWYIDAGVLYYRKDLLQKYGFSPPVTWSELVSTARTITAREKDLVGYVWQGKQYEGLVCNVLEYIWSNGGEILKKDQVCLLSPENIQALRFMKDLIHTYKITPPLVTTATEESTRHIFGNGRALFMRNWPYAWNLFERPGSAVKGRVGISSLPSFPPHQSASTLGGWQLGINAFSKYPLAAEKLVLFLTGLEAQKKLALTIGYKPSRRSLYRDQELIQEQPFITGLEDVLRKARPRPVSPYYMMISQIIQPEFSAVLAEIKTAEEALRSAQQQIEFMLKADR